MKTSSVSVEIRGQGPVVQGLTFRDLKVDGNLSVRKVRRKSRKLDDQRRQEYRELTSDHQTNFKCSRKRKQGNVSEDLVEKSMGVIGMLREVEFISKGVKKIKLDDEIQEFQPNSSGWNLESFWKSK